MRNIFPALALAGTVLVLVAATAFAQPDRPAVPTHDHPVIQGIQRHINALCAAHEKRQATIKSEADLVAERDRTRAKFLKLLNLPLDAARKPPEVRQVGVLEFDDYRIEKLVLLASPGVPVPCNLYLPKNGPARKAAILSPHGHGGRDWPHYQNAYQRFAKAGFIVLAKDGWGRQERRGTGHETQGGQLFLTGGSLMALELWDNMRCIDYLAARDDVDRERIGMAGVSGGGSQTLYAAAVDPRIKAASPTCAVTSFQADLADTNMCVCEVNADILSVGDHSAFLAMAYPRQWLVVNGTTDYMFPIAGTRASVAEAKRLYGLGKPAGRDEGSGAAGVELAEFPVGHAWNDDMLDAQLRFFRRAFGLPPLDKLPTAGEFVPYDQLQCFPGGDQPADSLTIADVHRQRMLARLGPLDTKARGRAIAEDVAHLNDRLKSLWSGEPKLPAEIKRRELPPDKQRFFVSERLAWPSGLGGEVSATVSHPASADLRAAAAKRVLVRFASEGPLDRVSHFYWNDRLRTQATIVELAYTGSDLSPQKEGESAMALVASGRSLPAERIRDLLVLLEVLRSAGLLADDAQLTLAARGNDAQLLLLAAPLLPERAMLVLDSTPLSYLAGPGIEYPDQPRSETSHWTVVPHLAERHDLLELVELAAPRRVLIFHPLDAAWQPLSRAACEEQLAHLTRTDRRHIESLTGEAPRQELLRRLNARVSK